MIRVLKILNANTPKPSVQIEGTGIGFDQSEARKIGQAFVYFAEHGKLPPGPPRCKYCGEPVDEPGQVHAGGCGNVG